MDFDTFRNLPRGAVVRWTPSGVEYHVLGWSDQDRPGLLLETRSGLSTIVKTSRAEEFELVSLPANPAEELVEEPTPPSKTQIGGDHYTKLKIQPMEYSMANGLDPLQHTIIKYVTRFRDKAGLEDLRKARHCIDMLIEHEEAKTE